jgi:DNA-binding winged helix-turn-helix (wHTH) protein/tetratricopeptide (TPR) repeat protein
MATEKSPVYAFGTFRLDVARRLLLQGESGEPIPLTSKVFDTLLYLVEHRGETLEKDALLRAIWPDLVVEENNLTQNISKLRQVLGEVTGENRFIATVPRKGYRFVAEVAESGPSTGTQTRRPRTPRPVIWAAMAVLAACLAGAGFHLLRPSTAANPLRSVVGGTQDSNAYLLYSNGRVGLARSSEASLVQAIGYFERAIARDPGFALAHARLAECHVVMGIFGMRPPADTFPQARDAVLKALRLEPKLAPALATLGHIKLQYDRDYDGAKADFDSATAFDPSLPEPWLYRGVLFAMRGDVNLGLEEIRRAQELEPLLTLYKIRSGSMLYFAHRYDEAIAELRESIALDDRFGIAHRSLGRSYLYTGQYELAAAEFEKCGTEPTPGSHGDLGQLLALSGHREAALAELDRILALAAQRYVSAVDIASIYSSLDERDEAIHWLDRALQQRAPTLGFLAQNPAFDKLHDDPRFLAIVARIGVWQGPLPD